MEDIVEPAFGKSIYCLAKIGEEIYIEALEDGLALKTVNSARSAYACFLFQKTFFHSYRDRIKKVEPRDGAIDEDESGLKCKILAKSIITVFRALATLERTVDHCTLSLNLEENKLVFVFHCKYGIVKTHSLGYQDCEALQAVFTKDLCPNSISAPAKVLSEVVTHFPAGLEEVTMTAHPSCVKLRNYVEDDGEGSRASLTEISMAPEEFEQYQIGVDVTITFCLKELRAILMFTDAINHSLSLIFEAPGRPVIFSINNGTDYKADFVLATLLDTTSPSTSLPAHNGITNTTLSSAAPTPRVVAQTSGNGDTLPSDDIHDSDISHALEKTGPPPSKKSINDSRSKRIHPASKISNKLIAPQSSVSSHQDFPSGSQFSRVNRQHVSVQEVSNVSEKNVHSLRQADPHIPAPPDDEFELDFMDTEGYEYQAGVNVGKTEEDIQGISLKDSKEVTTSGNFDVMDAIFGAENLNDVAEEGNRFGFGIENQCKRKQDKFKGHEHSLLGEHEKRSSLEQSREKDEDSFLQLISQDAMTQDSIINDSGFLPSTPPAKKPKTGPYSLLFGMDMFTDNHKSEVLAPDSDSD